MDPIARKEKSVRRASGKESTSAFDDEQFSRQNIARSDVIIGANLSIVTPEGKTIIKDLSLTIETGTKLAIIGMEGTGKSSLMKLLAGAPLDDFVTSGQVFRGRVGYLAQTIAPDWLQCSTVEFLLKDRPELTLAIEAWENYPSAIKALVKVGLPPELLDDNRAISTLSGGELVRVRIAKLLFNEPHVLLLDEPTNHLDLRTIKWLESFLVNTDSPVAFVSHDELLVERAANSILHLQYIDFKNETISTWSGETYIEFKRSQAKSIERSEQLAGNQTKEIRALKRKYTDLHNRGASKESKRSGGGMAEKNRASRGSAKAKGEMSRIRAKIDNTERVEKIAREDSIKIDLPVECTLPAGKLVCDLHLGSLKIGKRILAEEIHLGVLGPEKVVIIGDNGVGKSTFMRHLNESLSGRTGLKVGYMPQDYSEVLTDRYKRALDYLTEVQLDTTLCHTILARMNFTRDEILKPTGELSGGQQGKLLVARLMVSGSNVILLDEPTTNLSPLSAPVLRQAIAAFPGAVIAVSHDRAFINEVATIVYELTPKGLIRLSKLEIT